jgi:hypothetical protein
LIGSSGHDDNLAIRLEARQSGGVRGHASAHLVGHRAKYLRRFNAARDERGEPAQGGLFGGEPAIFSVQLATSRFSSNSAASSSPVNGPSTAS